MHSVVNTAPTADSGTDFELCMLERKSVSRRTNTGHTVQYVKQFLDGLTLLFSAESRY